MFSYLNHCKEHLTYENFINSLEFKEGYCKFNLTKSYIGSGYIIADFELNVIQKYKEKVLADGYILKTKDGSDNFFRDDINTYIYIYIFLVFILILNLKNGIPILIVFLL